MSTDRKTRKQKLQRQRVIERVTAAARAERDAIEHDRKVETDWMRFVAVRFPGSYTRPESEAS